MPASSKKNKRSGNPAKRPVTDAKSWKRDKGEELELPSGNVALVKRPGPQALLQEGIMPDTLMPIVQQAIKRGKGMKATDLDLDDPSVIGDMIDAIDKLMVKVVIRPEVVYHKCLKAPDMGGVTAGPAHEVWVYIDDDIRDGATECSNCGVQHPDDESVIYSDEVDLEDKFFIFNYAVGGTRDLERFREEHAAGLGNLSDVSGDESPSE